MTDSIKAPLPQLDDVNRFFWTSGANGELLIQRCDDCGYWLHPPSVTCSNCLSENLKAEAVSGLGTIVAATLNYQPWMPGMAVPFCIAIVELDEQYGMRLTTNIVGVPPEKVAIGQRVKVVFEQQEDVWLPLFTPI